MLEKEEESGPTCRKIERMKDVVMANSDRYYLPRPWTESGTTSQGKA